MSDPSTTPVPGPSDAPDHGPVADEEPTGHPEIDEALERLDRLDDLDLSMHPEQFDAIHGVMRESLAQAGRDGTVPESP